MMLGSNQNTDFVLQQSVNLTVLICGVEERRPIFARMRVSILNQFKR